METGSVPTESQQLSRAEQSAWMRGFLTVEPMDIDKLKQQVLASWHDGGMETLVKVMPLGSTPDNTRPIGYCTKFKYIAGRTAREIEGIVGFAADTKLVHGAEVFTV